MRVSAGALALAVVLLTALLGCGYHPAGRAVQLPPDLHTIAVPVFQNSTTSFRVEQVLTDAVVREFLARTQYKVISHNDSGADAVLHGSVTSSSILPLTSDTATGRTSTVLVTVTMKVSLVDRNGKALFENPSYLFREQYQLSLDPASFFQEDSPAFQRLARDFARTLVSNILEAF